MKLEHVLATRETKTVYREGDKAIKLFVKGYSKADILNEALNQARVEETDIAIPKLLGVNMIDGQWALETEYISGPTLAELMEQHPEREDEYIKKLVDIQLFIHSQNSPMLNKLKDKMTRKINQSGLDATTRYDLLTRLEAMPKHNKVCHGDLNPSNIIISEDGTAYVIDWSHATIGNASADVARTYLVFWLSGDISGADEYLDLYCKKSGTEKGYIQKWMPIVAASQLTKGNANQREFLMTWINVVDYD